MRKFFLTMLAIAVVAVPTAVWAGTTERWTRVDRQVVTTFRQDVSTSSTQWQGLLSVQISCPSSRAASADVSVALEGGSAPVLVRVRTEPLSDLGDSDLIAAPGAVPFAVGEVSDARSFTFSPIVSSDHGRLVRAQWRSPTGQPATITAAALHVIYDGSDQPCL